jgi:hypothetical protein
MNGTRMMDETMLLLGCCAMPLPVEEIDPEARVAVPESLSKVLALGARDPRSYRDRTDSAAGNEVSGI